MNLTQKQFEHCCDVINVLINDHRNDGEVESVKLLEEDKMKLITCYRIGQEMPWELQTLVKTLLE